MRLRHAVPAALALLSLTGPAAAQADEQVGTTTGGPLVTVGRVAMPAGRTLTEGTVRVVKTRLFCNFDECSFWLGPREGTAKALLGDFNPFLVQQVDLVRGQRRNVTIRYEALKDGVVEPVESFSVVARTDVRNAGGPWYDREDVTNVKIVDATPHVATSATALKQPLCYSC